jgi:hypothetical protein
MNKIKVMFKIFSAFIIFFYQCTPNEKDAKQNSQLRNSNVVQASLPDDQKVSLNGYSSLEEYGGHLVMIAGCHDCHTPKKMGLHGPELDMDLALSGHPSQMPPPDVNREDLESKGLVTTNTLTAWVGPWGISFAGNITSDETGIGNWTEENFFRALREGKFKGLPDARPILPPMPIEVYQYMTDEEIRAIFAYLKLTKPIKNIVPAPQPPVTAMK